MVPFILVLIRLEKPLLVQFLVVELDFRLGLVGEKYLRLAVMEIL